MAAFTECFRQITLLLFWFAAASFMILLYLAAFVGILCGILDRIPGNKESILANLVNQNQEKLIKKIEEVEHYTPTIVSLT